MSRRQGYDKYYLDVDCEGCGAYTGIDYAYRFGESKPTVYCSSCKSKRNRKYIHAAKHPQNHRRDVFCSQCRQYMRTVSSTVDNRTQYSICEPCKTKAPTETKKQQPATPPSAPSPTPTNDEIIDLQFAVQ